MAGENSLLGPAIIGAVLVGGLILLAKSSDAAPATSSPAPAPGTCPVTDQNLSAVVNVTNKSFAIVKSLADTAQMIDAKPGQLLFSRADCSFFHYDGVNWVTDSESNGVLLSVMQSSRASIQGHPASLFLI